MVELFMIRINDKISPSIIHHDVLPTLSAERQARVRKYRREEDARRSIVAEMLIRTIVMDKLKLTNSEIVFGETEEFRKPFLIHQSAFHFNLSHSGEWVVCAVDSLPVGVDVEQIRPMELDVAKRYFAAEEYADLMSRPEEEQLSYFYRLWTMKESYIKAMGQGLSIPLDSFICRVNEDGTSTVIEDEVQTHYLRTFPLGEYMVSVCAEEDSFGLPIEVQEEALIRRYLNLVARSQKK